MNTEYILTKQSKEKRINERRINPCKGKDNHNPYDFIQSDNAHTVIAKMQVEWHFANKRGYANSATARREMNIQRNKEEDSWLSRYRDEKNSPPHSPPQEEEIRGKQIAICAVPQNRTGS